MNIQDIFNLVAPQIREVEEELRRQAGSHVFLIRRIGEYLQSGGGKRLRPVVMVLSSRLCGFEGPEVIRLAAVVELIHTATLVHDDIIDNADLRRGRPSVNASWGNGITVLMGDWLFMTSIGLALSQRDFRILEVLTNVTRNMVEGELLQMELHGKMDITESQHLEISEYKTARLFSACSGMGAILSEADPQRVEDLESYGRNLGMAFQLADDLLDFTSRPEVLGKPVIHDLREGKVTLPIIYLLEDGCPSYLDKVNAAIQENGREDLAKQDLLRLIAETRTLDRARARAIGFSEKAKESLAGFPDSVAKKALLGLADFVVSRNS